MSNPTNDSTTEVPSRGMTRRAWLLSLPACALARPLMAREQAVSLGFQGLHQVTLAVSDVERSLDFYQGLFGMPVQARRGPTIFLRIGEGPRFLALTEAGPGPPRIDHFGIALDDFDVDRVVGILASHGVAQSAQSGQSGQSDGGEGFTPAAMQFRLSGRAPTPEVHMADVDGLVIQLLDPSYCGGDGFLGSACLNPEPAPEGGALPLRDLNHFTINVPDPERTNAFYQRAFGLQVQVMQAATAGLGVGTSGQFLMFTNGDRARINHVCLTMEDFDVAEVQDALEAHGIRAQGSGPDEPGPLEHWVSLRMPNRGGAPEGTPELYFSDPDGLRIQLQDVTYCGGGGYLGGVCP